MEEGKDYVLRERITRLECEIEALREIGRTRIDSLEKHLTQAIAASDKAIEKADTATATRFEGVNEFRRTLSDQTATFISREVTEARFAEIDRRIAALTEKLGQIA